MSKSEEIIKQIKKRWQAPIIGVIGATSPDEEYSLGMGVDVGYVIRKLIDKKGSMFTGGVDGVGADVYAGVIKYCITQGISQGKMPEDRFFVLIPKYVTLKSHFNLGDDQTRVIEYNPPQAYEVLAALSERGKLDIERAGYDMGERREYVAGVADGLVTVNGGFGTLDEAIQALELGTRVITLPNTGGAAKLLALVKEENVPPKIDVQMRKGGLSFDRVDLDNIFIANSLEEMSGYLSDLI